MNDILDFKKFANLYDEKWEAIVTSEFDHREKYVTIVDFLKFLSEQYENGLLGYMMYPSYIVSLFALDVENYHQFNDILNLAVDLEWPDKEGKTTPRTRLDETEKLSKLIWELPPQFDESSKDRVS